MKEFKTNEKLISILESKGVIFNNKELAFSNLSKYSYYSIINTYKWIFKTNDHYKDGVTFEEIFSVYKFDKTLKNIFHKYILEIESIVKSKISNAIGQKYGVNNYLTKENFSADIDKKIIRHMLMIY